MYYYLLLWCSMFWVALKKSFISQTPVDILLTATYFIAGTPKLIQLSAASYRIIHGNWWTELPVPGNRASHSSLGNLFSPQAWGKVLAHAIVKLASLTFVGQASGLETYAGVGRCCSFEAEFLLQETSVFACKAFQRSGWGPFTLSRVNSFS